MTSPTANSKMSPVRLILSGYALIILLGTVLLSTPYATRTGISPSIVDALFTATSATCVTGLIVRDTWRFWSGFGQGVIITLIQVGGLGFLTFAVLAATFTGRKIGLRERKVMQDSISAPQIGGIVRMTKFICQMTFIIEGTGAVLFATRFVPQYGWKRGIWFSIFHSISAFCNAGFDLMGDYAPRSSLVMWKTDFAVNFTAMALIVIAGLGYFVWADVRENHFRFARYKLHTKIVLVTSAALIIIPAILIFIFEYNGTAFQGLNFFQKIQAAIFQSITTRTAGFNTVELSDMTDQSKILMTFLMIIGGSPGSTAGGLKTTTAAVLFLCVVSAFRRRQSCEAFGRRISDSTIRNAVCVLVMYLALFLSASMALCAMEGVTMQEAFFEVGSAVGTVGLTLGITSKLGVLSKILLILLMFFGRVGSLTILYAFSEMRDLPASKLPEAPVTIG